MVSIDLLFQEILLPLLTVLIISIFVAHHRPFSKVALICGGRSGS